MNAERRERLDARRRAQAGLTRASPANNPIQLSSTVEPDQPVELIVYSENFMIELQLDEDGAEGFAVYRLTDMVSTVHYNGVTPEPVHLFDQLSDAVTFARMMDQVLSKLYGVGNVKGDDDEDGREIDLGVSMGAGNTEHEAA